MEQAAKGLKAPNKYAKGKIYELVYKDMRYIGSTTRTLAQRFNGHKCRSHTCASKDLFDMADADCGTVSINLIEDWPCESKSELEARERFHIEQCRDRVNKKMPCRSGAEWCQDNKDKVADQQANWYKVNKDKVRGQRAEYRQANKGEIAEKKAEWYQANKDRVCEHKAVKIDCPCGVTHTYGVLARHAKSKRHIDYLRGL